MALLNNKSMIVPSILIDLTFEDGIYKQMLIHENDVVTISYNKDGLKCTITGRVTQIGNGDYTSVGPVPRFYGSSGIAHYDTIVSRSSKAGEYIIVDGSGEYSGKIEVVYLNTILDCKMLNKYSDSASIMSPKSDCCGTQQITGMRYKNGKAQISLDYGQTWLDLVASSESSEDSETDSNNNCECQNNG